MDSGRRLPRLSIRASGSTNLWRVPVSGGVPEALTTGAGDDLDPVVTADGGAVLFTNVKRTSALVVHDRGAACARRFSRNGPTSPSQGIRRTAADRVLREKLTRRYASVRDALGCDEPDCGHGWCGRTQHHAAMGAGRQALFLPGASDADVSARSRLRRCYARDCPLVLESTASRGGRSPRARGPLFSDGPRTRAVLAST